MDFKNIRNGFLAWSIIVIFVLAGCATATGPADASAEETAEFNTLAPERVDIRGSILSAQYYQGQVMLEVEGYAGDLNSRYRRAFVLVLPTVQILKPDGKTISLHELRQGQDVAIVLRGGGRGSFVGVGEARRMWIEERL
ncbi:hypothetical protein [Rufibacter roseus]|uniref:DUF3221 domain-containing protein n=1 Tax=Rufibacter roseus TaxID=1567108 RepID=A0ABW2DIG5_9BACT|nr:hypothetical protein [Rufibacter roseus]